MTQDPYHAGVPGAVPGAGGAVPGGSAPGGSSPAGSGTGSTAAGARYADPSGKTFAEERASTSSLGDLLSEVSRDVSTLMRQEVALAKAELRESASKAGKGAGMLGGAGFAGYMVLLFLSLALAWALGNVMDLGWAGLIVAVIWGIIGAVLYVVGKKDLKNVKGMPETTETVKEFPATFKPGENKP
jgi:hypothetical protein